MILLQAVVTWARDRGLPTPGLWAAGPQPRTGRLYHKVGFSETGAEGRCRRIQRWDRRSCSASCEQWLDATTR